ncbi:LLM class flavin-dependent oxidoreductase [Sphingobium subterraneum]|uniref:Luciferase-like monooxygenase n=1 Tax=Sphingobium subterraneum TaxID=627688 RepID=A0A841IXY2_9SPHN|nr:LLM class flavin-dependent oxidoreductase [Sphingobium subterraneum]MBB6123477.1 luciferase family oxidoreductase group 1 [Sphingobium subterraneum]
MPLISVLDLVRVRQGGDISAALQASADLAHHVEDLGYHRFWVAEHHNLRGVASAATAVVVGHLAAATKTIRVGAGGIMLPNHAPMIIAEQFGTLEALFPGRIDLGLGRAPGTDQMTLRALRRDPMASEHFPQDVQELQAFLGPVAEGQRIVAVPGAGTNVPLWILGSSLFGAQLAAQFGLPYAFASHFAPSALLQALQIYRARFQPSAQLATSHAAIGVNIIAAETDAEAQRLFTTQQMSFADVFRGDRGLSKPPIDNIDDYWSPMEKAQVHSFLERTIVGSFDTVKRGMAALLAETGADELIIVSDVFDHDLRKRSYTMIAEAAHALEADESVLVQA